MFPVFILVFTYFSRAVTSHPQCLDFMPPFKPSAVFPLCHEYQTFGCCDGSMENSRVVTYLNFTRTMTRELQNSCGPYIRSLLCQKCSPYAAHLYNVEEGGNPSNIPGLCPAYCQTMIARCPSVVGLFTTDARLLNLVQSGNAIGFCSAVAASDPDYCYPDLITNPILSTNLGSVKFYQKTGACIRMCVQEVANRLYSPLSAKHSKDGTHRLFVVEQRGVIWIYLPDRSRLNPPFLNLSDVVLVNKQRYDERGLLDIEFHPNYRNNGRFYLYYSYSVAGRHHVKISELKVSDIDMNRANVSSEKTLMTIPQPAANHNGGQLLFQDGFLFIFTGDGGKGGDPWGEYGNGQNKKTLLGKVLRIDVDSSSTTEQRPYSIPPDNPFVNNINYLPEIYALGVRNMWRCSADRGDETGKNKGRIFCGDVGQNKYEEIDIIEKGGNYGWRAYEGYSCFDDKICNNNFLENYIRPIHVYGHSTGKSVTGGYVYRGCQNPNLKGKYIFGDYMNGKLFTLNERSSGVWKRESICLAGSNVCKNGGLQSSYGKYILSFGEDEDGEIYMLSTTKAIPGNRGGSVYKLVDPSRRGNPSKCVSEITPTIISNGTERIPYNGISNGNIAVRLVNLDGVPHQGRVEVQFDGEWGTICDDSWDLNDGDVVCRMLGFKWAISAPRLSRFGEGTGQIWLDEVRCDGLEESIVDCKRNDWGDHNCIHKEDASVICQPKLKT